MPPIDRYGKLVVDPLDGSGVQLTNKPLLGLIAEGTGSFNIEVSIDAGATWYALDPAVSITAGVAVSSNTLAPVAAYCVQPVMVRLAPPTTGVTAATWICSG